MSRDRRPVAASYSVVDRGDLCRIVSTIPLCAGCVALLWHPRGQTWHDRMANTVVVNTTAAPATVASTVAT